MAKRKATPKITLKDTVLWVISRRTKLFFWEPFHAFETEDKAREFLRFYDETAKYSGRSYKVDRVELITKSLEEVFDSLETP